MTMASRTMREENDSKTVLVVGLNYGNYLLYTSDPNLDIVVNTAKRIGS
jgi:hypothetical protein